MKCHKFGRKILEIKNNSKRRKKKRDSKHIAKMILRIFIDHMVLNISILFRRKIKVKYKGKKEASVYLKGCRITKMIYIYIYL